MTEALGFLSDLAPRRWSPGRGLRAAGLFLGKGANALEVAVARAGHAPGRTALLDAWKARRGGRAAPVLLVALHPDGAALCGAAGETPPTHLRLDPGRVERLCREALGQPDRHAALRFLAQALPSLETPLPGLCNEGLLALHELRRGVPERADWAAAGRKAAAALGKRDGELLRALGFRIEPLDNLTGLLRADGAGGGRRAALAVTLRESESPEAGNDRFNSLSPVSYALKKADDENLPWVVLTQGARLRLYAAAVNAGVGRRGRTGTFIECQTPLLAEEHSPYLWLLWSAEALAPGGSLEEILESSRRFAGDLAERLRERIYDEAVPALARGVAAARGPGAASPGALAPTYEMALTALFRLLFIAYAEDRDLLPWRTNDSYRRRSLKEKARELARRVADGIPVAEGDAHWREAATLWRAVANGNTEWGVSALDGGLFSDDPDVSPAGAELAKITLPNEAFEAALRALLVIETAEGAPGPVDFRSLGVREFGTIYEGLLESELARAETDLALKKRKNAPVYAPARAGDAVAVAKGAAYLHDRSGARKSSGSYYTRPFAVDHLLAGALEPALDAHFARLDRMDDTDAAEAFFDFRVADIAMGSGHFLVAAIDRIERRMAGYLARRRLPGARRDLAALRDAAADATGEAAGAAEIEDGALLRRQIARRCIYGVDLNALSVQLARLAVWIHTFVPGLPLSFLDRNLARGNALVGVGGLDDIRREFEAAAGTIFAADAETLLGAAKKPLRRLANIADRTVADIAAARAAEREARAALADTEALCDLIAAQPVCDDARVTGFPFEDWTRRAGAPETRAAAGAAKRALAGLRARHFPGLRGQTQRAQESGKARLREERPDLVAAWRAEREEMERVRKALVGGGYPGMGTGDPDLYKAFCWRFWRLSAEKGGRIGVVLPRSALAARGSTEFRRTIFKRAAQVEITMLLNNRRWVFPEVHPRYAIGLVCIARDSASARSVRLRGPYASETAFREAAGAPGAAFDPAEALAWNDTASLPLLPDVDSVGVFLQLRKASRLDMNITGTGGGGRKEVRWRARPDRELDATLQKAFMVFEAPETGGAHGPTRSSTPPRGSRS